MRLQHCVNAENSSCSNWLRHVNYARSEEEQNLIAFQYRGEIYYRSVSIRLVGFKLELQYLMEYQLIFID